MAGSVIQKLITVRLFIVILLRSFCFIFSPNVSLPQYVVLWLYLLVFLSQFSLLAVVPFHS